MGTPGDKAKIEEVVPHHAGQLDPADSAPQPPSDMGHVLQPSLADFQQAHIEDYFAQTKYYPSVSENPDEPGPSGLQLASKRPLKPKRAKKSQSLLALALQKKTPAPFKCDTCKKSFSSKFKLVRHVLIHSDSKPFSCTVCERTFHRKDHLTNHVKVHSPCKKVYACEKPDCRKEYTSLMSYRKHLALHAAEEGGLECKICASEFASKEEILHHLKIHAGSRTVKGPGDKKFRCDVCGRMFFTKKDVRRHHVVHTGMRDFLCQFCPQRFGRKDHLVRHIKKSHSGGVGVKLEPTETAVKPEELSESSLSNAADLSFSLDDFDMFGRSETVALPFLETAEEMAGPSGIGTNAGEMLGQLANTDLLVVSPSEQNMPLPGFSQTFHTTPPPPP